MSFERTSPSSGSSKIPLTVSLFSSKLISGNTPLYLFCLIHPLSTRIVLSLPSILRGVMTLYPAIPLFIMLSIKICSEFIQLPLTYTLSHFFELSSKFEGVFLRLSLNSFFYMIVYLNFIKHLLKVALKLL